MLSSSPPLDPIANRPLLEAPTTDPELDVSDFSWDDADAPAATDADVPFDVGAVIGGVYELRERLGRGGMGVVYEAHDRLLNRPVAVKLSLGNHPGYSLSKEGEALAAIRHPSTVTVHAMGVHEGVEYLVMERVHGITLEEHLWRRRNDGEPLSVAEAVDLLIGIGDGLAAVHRAGISHRDIKPGNVMLADKRVVLMDFGLFCPEFCRAPSVAGSPEYMAPEVAMNRVCPGQGRLADVYSFGVVAYHLLAGRPPFAGEEAIEVFARHIREPVPDVGAARPETPPELRRLVRDLLAKRPTDRPQSIDAVLWQLRALRRRLGRSTGDAPFSVLIVDHDAAERDLLRELVAEAAPDADVRTARDGASALASLRSRAPDVMLLDLDLPGMSGFELSMHLRGTGLADECRIVSLSSAAVDYDVALLRQLGITRFLPKSADLPEKLVSTLRELRRANPPPRS